MDYNFHNHRQHPVPSYSSAPRTVASSVSTHHTHQSAGDFSHQQRSARSPTAFPGRIAAGETLFPDLKRDEIMSSKSTISTKEAGGGDYWSVSAASEDRFRSSHPINRRSYEQRRYHHAEDPAQQHYMEEPIQRGERRTPPQRKRYPPSASRFSEFDDRPYQRRYEDEYDAPEYQRPRSTRSRAMYDADEDDGYGLLPPILSPRRHVVEDAYYNESHRQYPRRGRSPSRRKQPDYSDYYQDDEEAYDHAVPSPRGYRRSISPLDDDWERTRGGRRSSDWHDEEPPRRRSVSRGRSRERRSIKDYVDSRSPRSGRRRGGESTYAEDYEEDWDRPRSSRMSAYNDDDHEDDYDIEIEERRRNDRRRYRYDDDEDDDDNNSAASIEREYSSRNYRSRSKSAEPKASRRRSRSRDRRQQPPEIVVNVEAPDLETSSGMVDQREVTFSPSTEVPVPTPSARNYNQRIADASLLKEQSEARHQILKEIRQAMEMRDLATDLEDRNFWDRQVNALNASLQRLWENSQTPNSSQAIPVAPGNQRQHFATEAPAPVVKSFTTVKVQAPESLPADHQFTIRVNGKPLAARVPKGGVRKGDIFTIRIPLNGGTTTTTATNNQSAQLKTVKVRAPAALQEGYRFTARMGDKTIVATVPRGGVKQGEIFSVNVRG